VKKYCVIGDPILHSLSPELHHNIYSILGIDASYQKVEVSRNKLKPFMNSNSFDGMNITIPHKKSVVSFLDGLDKDAESIGVVNCVMDNYGYNTDWVGFLKAMDLNDVILKNKHCLILGSGGAAIAIAYALISAKAGSINIESRNKNQSKFILDWIKSYFPRNKLSNAPDIIINCTPLGMFPNFNQVPIEMSVISKDTVLIDTIYNPIETQWLLFGKKLGAKVVGGMDMFIAQGVLSAEIWFGIDIFNRLELDIIKQEIKEIIC